MGDLAKLGSQEGYMSVESVKANTQLARESDDIKKKLDYLACAVEELANALKQFGSTNGPAPQGDQPERSSRRQSEDWEQE